MERKNFSLPQDKIQVVVGAEIPQAFIDNPGTPEAKNYWEGIAVGGYMVPQDVLTDTVTNTASAGEK